MILLSLWYKLAKSEKQRRRGAVRQWHFREGFKGKCSFGCMHQAFARCFVMVQKSFGRTFGNVSGAPEALVSYSKWLGGQQDGKYHSSVMVEWNFDLWRQPLKEDLRLNTSYLIQ